MSKDNVVSFPKDAKSFEDSEIRKDIEKVIESAFYGITEVLESDEAIGKNSDEIVVSVYSGLGNLTTCLFYYIAERISECEHKAEEVAHELCSTFSEQLRSAMQHKINHLNGKKGNRE